MIGSEKASRNCTTSPIQTKTGILNSVIPGARMLMIVTMKFTAPAVDAMPVMIRPERVEASCPIVGSVVEFGA